MPSVITPCGGSGGGDWTLLATVDPGIAVTGYDFTAVDQTGTHLAIVLAVRSTRAAPNTADYVRIRFNGDATAIYYSQYMYGQGAGAGAGEFLGETRGRIGFATAVSAPAATPAPFVVYIPYYKSVSDPKTWLADCVTISGTATTTIFRTAFGGGWLNATPAAITRIEITPDLGAFFEAHSVASLYMLA